MEDESLVTGFAKAAFLAVASVLAALSIKPAILVLAFICCVPGAVKAPPTSSKLRDACVFLASVFIGAAGGAWIGMALEGKEVMGITLNKAEIPATALLSLFFHPLFNAASVWLPAKLMKADKA